MTPRPWTSAAALLRCRQASTLDLARMATAATARGWMLVLPRGAWRLRAGALAALVALAAGLLSAATFCLCPPGRTPLPSLCGRGARAARAVRAVRAMTTG